MLVHYKKIVSTAGIIFRSKSFFAFSAIKADTILCAVCLNRCFLLHCQRRDFGVKMVAVLRKVLIDFPKNPLELGKIGEDFQTLIFTVFFDIITKRTLKTSGFSGFSLRPLSSVKFRQVRFLTLDSKSGKPLIGPESSNLSASAKRVA